MRGINAGSTNTHYWFCIGSGFLAGLLAFFICTHDFDFHWPFRMPVTITKSVIEPVTIYVESKTTKVIDKPLKHRYEFRNWHELLEEEKVDIRWSEKFKEKLKVGDKVNGKGKIPLVGGQIINTEIDDPSGMTLYLIDFPSIPYLCVLYRSEIEWVQ